MNRWLKSLKKLWGLNCIANLLILISKITGCVSIFSFVSLVGITTDIASSKTGVKFCVVTAGSKKSKSIKKSKSMIKKYFYKT